MVFFFKKLDNKKKENKIIKYKTICSGKWKIFVAKKWMRENGYDRVNNWIGISKDEERRISISNLKWFRTSYPLIDLNIERDDCSYLIGSYGIKLPVHSSCIMCPNRRDTQWSYLKENYPDDFQKAVNIDVYLRTIDKDVYLHRSCIPLGEIDFNIESKRYNSGLIVV